MGTVRIGVLGFSVSLMACGGSTTQEDDTGSDEQLCASAEVGSGQAATGLIYTDSDGSDRSSYLAAFDSSDQGIGGADLKLIGADGTTETSSCEDGTYAFNDLSDGVYVVSPVHPDGDCMQRNCARRFPEAMSEGQVKIVTLGDSVAVQGTQPYFPSRVKTLFSGLANVTSENVAVGGTISTQWLPGTTYFENSVRPELADTDVVVMSIGGNDILYSLDASALQDPDGAVEEIRELIYEIGGNVVEISEAIHEENPDIDVLYCLYVNYGEATVFPWSLVSTVVPEGAVEDLLSTARDSISVDEDILLVDLFGASMELDSLDDYLYDELHFNDRGQTFYAEEIFKTLGGVLVGDSPLDGSPRSPLGLEQSWSFSGN